MWITGDRCVDGACVDHREDRSGVGSDVGCVWITGRTGQE